MTASLLAGPAVGIAAAVQAGTATAVALVAESFRCGREVNAGRDGLNAFVSSDEDLSRVLAASAPCDGPLAGVPVAIKDNIATTYLTTSCGSKMLQGYVSPFEATAARKLREAGAVLVGKTTMDEFGMGSSTEHCAFGPAKNPIDPTRVPGGSSGAPQWRWPLVSAPSHSAPKRVVQFASRPRFAALLASNPPTVGSVGSGSSPLRRHSTTWASSDVRSMMRRSRSK